MQTILLVIQIFIALALIGVILIQRSSSDGLGLSGSGNSFMSGRASANLLTRTTAILAALFMANCLLLAWIASHSGTQGSVINQMIEEEKPAEVPANTGEPSVPVAK